MHATRVSSPLAPVSRPAAESHAPGPPAAPSTPSQAAPLQPSPKLTIDPALSLVVLEFRDDSGAVVNTIPSARQLAAYHNGQQPRGAKPR